MNKQTCQYLYLKFSKLLLVISNKFFVLFLLIFALSTALLEGRRCYSCSGQCLAGAPCNCQMGSCEADYCFAEKQPSEIPGIFRLSKGCVKRPSRTRAGCDFDHFSDHVLCVCAGPDFCNDQILMHVNTATWRNVTCRQCPDGRPDCGQTCQGQWCHQKTSTGAAGCGFGPPSLPYLYKTAELLQRQQHVCLSISRGGGVSPQRFCICGGKNMCNSNGDDSGSDSSFISSLLKSLGGGGEKKQQREQQQRRQWEMSVAAQKLPPLPPLYECINCDMSAEDVPSSMTSGCRQNKCKGHFCVYAAQRIFSNNWSTNRNGNNNGQQTSPSPKMHEKRGCINVTTPTFVQLGCTHKWVQNELEEIYCACKGNTCNFDLATASQSLAEKQLLVSPLKLIFFLLFLFIFYLIFSALIL
ncbi:unnamed protein product [Meloidogyne enterolobii]|uniref:Uncharacterized protein n=1 Tax=Meloidogyne enterolobii TaxID=390850 RepID=A0ACB0Z3A9_MELEN